jgi:hypothetical protein
MKVLFIYTLRWMPNKSLRLISKEFNFPKKIHFVTINEIRAKKKEKTNKTKQMNTLSFIY